VPSNHESSLKRSNLLTVAAMAVTAGFSGALIEGDARNAAGSVETTPAAVTVAAPAPAVVRAPVVRQAARAVLDKAGIESGVENARVQRALAALGGSVRKQSDPSALKMAFAAYYNYKAANPEKVRKPYLYFVDYGLDSKMPRGYVFDMEALKVVEGPFTVAHGRGSAPATSGVPRKFSNREGSAATSLGLYLTQETYGFSGKAAGKYYTSIGLRMKGLSGRFNSAARQRGVVAHGAPYVTAGRAGRSEGCPAMEQARARRLLPKIGNGALVFLFSPLDRAWMDQDPWAGDVIG
jgi:hypothetical protein